MQLNKKQLELLNRRKLVVLTTSNKDGEPRAIIVEVNRVEGHKIIITDNEMRATKNNFLENNNVFLLAFEEDYHYGLKISGKVSYYIKGKYFDFVRNLDVNKDYSPKGAVVVTVKKIVEF